MRNACVVSNNIQAARYVWATEALTQWHGTGYPANSPEILTIPRDHEVVPPNPGQFTDWSLAGATWVSLTTGSTNTSSTRFLADLGDAQFRLLRALPITVYSGAGPVVAYSYDLDEMGIGETESEALADIRSSLVETYLLLRSEQNNLGPLQALHWEFLKDIVESK